ncbi:class II aldolase/adducin family protein [Vibrio sp. VPAP30]|uniref:class II aldolase/adducin family protein n=1 Tax=Vibrio sp. VPAP30 TaxID=1647102 RepID=UPI0006762F37|nr:class II aldolase/adducin family protein [Vibrio sp. VPAP30]
MLKYRQELAPADVGIIFYDQFNDPELINQAIATSRTYGLNIQVMASLDDALQAIEQSQLPITHSILRLQDAYDEALTHRVKHTTAAHYTSSSLAFSYANDHDAVGYENQISTCKTTLGRLDGFNLIRPNIYNGSRFTASHQKLVDNIICDTIRIKYRTHCRSDQSIVNQLPDQVRQFFIDSAQRYGTHHMYHRSETDGYFAIKAEGKIYITATKTPKAHQLDLHRIVMIEAFDRSRNLITYSGAYIPSSDAVEACVIFDRNPDVNQIVHTHDSINFTRNERAKALFPMIGEMAYGEPELGDAITQCRASTQANCIVMEEHGEVFLGTAQQSAANLIHTCLQRLTTNDREYEAC